VERYGFLTYPKEPKDFDLSEKGVRFEEGKSGDLTIQSLVIYDQALYLDTLSSTEDSKKILMGMLSWGKDDLGLTYDTKMLTTWGYVSQLIFRTDFPLLAESSGPIRNLAARTSEVTEALWGGLKYEATRISIGHDPIVRKHAIASLIVEHQVNTRFDENKYFSEAPLPTHLHIRFLEEFEADVLRQRGEDR
jgi:hypothetical protein